MAAQGPNRTNRSGRPARQQSHATQQPLDSERLELYTQAIENLFAPLIITDMDGVITRVNQAVERLYGFPPGDLIGQHVRVIDADPDKQRDLIIPQTLEKGGWNGEVQVKRKDGTLIPEHLTTSLVRNSIGDPMAIIGIVRDMTQDKKTQEELALSHERLRLATEALSVGIWDWDIQKNELFWDDRMYELYGIQREDFRGAYEAWLVCIHPEDRAKADEISSLSLTGQGDYSSEFRIVRPDGEVREIRSHASILRDADGKAFRMTGVNYDATESNRIARELENTARALSERVKELDCLHDIAQLVSDPHIELEDILRRIANLLRNAFQYPDGTSIRIVLGDKEYLSEGFMEIGYRMSWDVVVAGERKGALQVICCAEDQGACECPFLAEEHKLLVTVAERVGRIMERHALERERQFLAEIFTHMAEGVLLTRCHDGVIILSNRCLDEMFGYSSGELRGKHISILNAGGEQDPVEIARGIINSLNATGRWRGEVLNVRKDGSVFWTYASITEFDHPTLGRVWLTVQSDITEQKLADQRIQQEKKRAEDYLNVSQVMLLALDPGGRVSLINPKGCELLGYEREEVLGKDWFDHFLPPRIRDQVREVFTTLMSGRGTIFDSYENQVLVKSGEERLFSWYNSVMRDPSGDIVGILCSAIDITERKQAEETLARSEARYRSLIESSSDHIFTLDAQGNFTSSNLQSHDVCLQQGVVGKSLRDLLSPEVAEDYLNKLGQVISETRSVSFEHWTDTPHGREYHIDTLFPIVVEGQVLSVGGICHDITERKAVEERFRVLFHQSPVGAVIVTNDFHFLRCNESFCKFLGYREDELIGRTFLDVTNPDDQTIGRPEMQAMLAGELEIATVEKRYQRKDGEVVWGQVTIRILRDAEGKPLHFLGVIQNITDRVASEKKTKTLLETIPDRMFLLSRDGIFIDCHIPREAMQFVDPVSLQGQSVQEIIPSDVAEKYIQQIQESLSTGEKRIFEYHLDFPSGERRYFEARMLPSGSDMVMAIVRDISELRQAQEERIKVQRLESLGILAGGIAHDFNNLLSGILGNIEMARMSCAAGSKAASYLDRALGVTGRARDLTGQLLTFAKGGDPVRKPGDLGKVVSQCVQFALTGSNVSPTFCIDPVLLGCEFDESQISQAIENIVINAVQAMPSGGSLEVEVLNTFFQKPVRERTGHHVMVSIRDHGIGIPEKILPQIFDPFFTTKQKGSGLGLATTHSIIQRHGGFIEVESTPNEGTTFRLYLPASKRDVVEGRDEKLVIESGVGRILVMDDEEFIRDLVSAMLTSLGYSVVAVEDGTEACLEYEKALVSNEPFKAVILDLTVPGGQGGREAVQDLRRLDPEVIVIAASGYSTDPVMSSPTSHGFSGSVRKPFGRAELANRLKSLCPEG